MARKITIIGAAGRSGVDTIAEIANRKILKTGDEIVLVDINERAMGLIGEVKTAFERQGELPKITPVNAFRRDEISRISDSDIVVMAASIPFPKGGFRTRDWGLYKNQEINNYYARAVGELAPKSLVIIDTNPLDVLTAQFCKDSGMDAKRVIGKGGDLDTQRLHSVMARHIAKKMGSPDAEIAVFRELQRMSEDVCMAGVHSAEHMVPVIQQAAMVAGKPISEWFDEEDLRRTIEIAKNVGPKSSRQLEIGSPSLGGAIVNCDLMEKLYSDTPQPALVSVPLHGLYDLGDTSAYACTRAMLSSKGVESTHELPHIRNTPALMDAMRAGAEDVEERLSKIPAYMKLREAVGDMPPLDAIVEHESGIVVIGPRIPGSITKQQMQQFFDAFKPLLLQPNRCLVELADDKHIRFIYPHPTEVAALLETLHIEPVHNVMEEISATRDRLEKLTALAMRHHPQGGEAQRWQDRAPIATGRSPFVHE